MKLILLIIAIVLFLLDALGITLGINILAWGLVAFACSFLPLPSN